MWKLGIGVASVMSLAALGLTVLHLDHESRARFASLEKQVGTLSAQTQENATISAGNSVVMQHLVQSATVVPVAASASAASHETPAASATEPPRPPKPQTELRQELEFAFQQDRGDPRWSAADKRTALDKLTASLPEGSSIRSVECHETMCRVDSLHADMQAYRAYAHSTFIDSKDPAFAGGGIVMRIPSPDGQGPIQMVSYVSRNGPLPVTM